jgi:hypothetical protein
MTVAIHLSAFSVSAQQIRPPRGHTRFLSVPKIDKAPAIDGKLDEEVWTKAAVGSDFWISEQERWPTEKTEVLVLADADHLYFGFRVYDSQPDLISALETRRDADLQLDDQVCVELDPFLSHREVSSYCINARGTVSDSIAGGRAGQLAWKGIWDGAAQRTPYGWSAEIYIPFRILNYEAGSTTFGVNFVRYHNLTAEWSRWADTTVWNFPEERGRLTGLSVPLVAQGSPLIIMPYVLLGRNIPDKEGDIKETLFTGGVDIRYQPRPNLTGVLTINPDFSQVEEAVTDITFSYNEKYRVDNRPFFQEGAAYFGKTEYFYSNRVPDFDVGAKLFGRHSRFQYGFLATRSPDARTDTVMQVQWEIDPSHSANVMATGTDQSEFRNGLIAGNFKGREPFGLLYEIDAAISRTDMEPGDGSFLQGMAGWMKNFWTLKLTGSRYTLDYRPELGLVDVDLLDTYGVYPSVSYYRDMGTGPVREVNAYATWSWRETEDGRLQRSIGSTGGTIELRKQIRLGLDYYAGSYRPLIDGIPGNWSDDQNHDRYLGSSIDFNTRSSVFLFGGTYAAGNLGGGEYEYMSGYVTSRPTATTFLNISAERVDYFGYSNQVVATAGWDVTPRHALYARYIWSDDDDYYRAAYTWRISKNVDLFAVYDKVPGADASISAKLLVSLPVPFSHTSPPKPKPPPMPKPIPREKMQDWWRGWRESDVAPVSHRHL